LIFYIVAVFVLTSEWIYFSLQQ